GATPITYQWYRNNSMIAGATNSTYTTPPASFASSSSIFNVRVVNNFGSTASSNATLTVEIPTVHLVPFTNIWKYNQNGQNLGTAWREIDYVDSSWPSGRGGLGFESTPSIAALINTTLNLNGTTSSQIPTFYFRAH